MKLKNPIEKLYVEKVYVSTETLRIVKAECKTLKITPSKLIEQVIRRFYCLKSIFDDYDL